MWSVPAIATLPTTSEAMSLNIPSPDVNAVLPVALLCFVSILCTAIWFVTVSNYTTKRHETMA